MNILDTLSQKPLKELSAEETDAINDALYEETGSIGFSYENFDDYHLTLYAADPESVEYLNWPIPALRTVGEAVALARQLKAATVNHEKQAHHQAPEVTAPISVDQTDPASPPQPEASQQTAATHTSAAQAMPRGKALLEEHFQNLDTELAALSANQSAQELKSDASPEGSASPHSAPATCPSPGAASQHPEAADQTSAPAAGTIPPQHEPHHQEPLPPGPGETHAAVQSPGSKNLELHPSSSPEPTQGTARAS